MGAEGDSSDPKLSGGNGGAPEQKPEEPQTTQESVVINLRCPNGAKYTVRATLDSTVAHLKTLSEQASDVPAQQQKLIYKGRILKDDQTLQSYGLQADHTVHMVRGFAQSQPSPAPSPAPAANTATANPAPGVTRGVGSNNDGGLGDFLFPGLGLNLLGAGVGAPAAAGAAAGGRGSGGPFAPDLPEFELVQQQLTQNPNMMREIMNMPAMQSLLNNPDLIRNLMTSNPQLREIMDRNPELAHVLNDPSILRQTLDVARNPELMREMMRHTDRAMSNIESTPEGFNMLRRMYENVQEPFLNATTMGANAANNQNQGSNPFAALLGNQAGAQRTDTPNNPSTTASETAAGFTAPNTNPLPNPWNNTAGTQTNTAARSNPATGNMRIPPFGFPGGDGLPGMPDSNQVSQLMQNPAISQMVQSVLSNPEYMNQMLNFNPQLRSMVDANPQLREMMQNPELLRQLTSPETMQQMLTLQQSLFSQLNRQSPNQEPTQPGAATGIPNNTGLEALMNMFGGLGTGGFSVPNQPDVPPEELYATQLSQLQEMGFFDTQENIRALRATAGNVHAAVERLLGNLGQ
ncbi:hypothetical protein Tsubulata_020737 [Turnera subulata]|uniref:Uncharacterized protein n=1 Tax=Turnera subulata TaxID=218843 RepID=A0A9Q0FE01_9ROSI|nr:hypothetical protein Tsubulata_020737 [Turnera subulata]